MKYIVLTMLISWVAVTAEIVYLSDGGSVGDGFLRYSFPQKQYNHTSLFLINELLLISHSFPPIETDTNSFKIATRIRKYMK